MLNVRKVPGIVLRTIRYSNTSRIVTFFTEEYGKVAAVAKGARRIKNQFGAGLEPFLVAEMIYYHRDGRSLQILAGSDIIIPFVALRENLVRRVYAYAACELLNRMAEDRCADLFRLTVDYLRLLELVPGRSVPTLFWSYQLKAYALLGFRPHLDCCPGCGALFGSGNVRPVLTAGGVLCGTCGSDDPVAETVSAGTVRLLARLLDDSPAAVGKYRVTAAQHEEADCFFDYYIRYHSGWDRELVSLQSLRDLTGMEA